MKRSTLYILAGALVLLILLTASCACCDFKPHSKKVHFSKYEGMEGEEEKEEEEENLEETNLTDEALEGFGYPYEGMEDEEEYEEGMDDMPEDDVEEEDSVEETMINKMKKTLGITNEKEGVQNMSSPCPYGDEYTCGNYDIYGPPTKGSLDCGSQSAGLSNSKGPLCLSKKQLDLLKTRGGNATTDAQIGA